MNTIILIFSLLIVFLSIPIAFKFKNMIYKSTYVEETIFLMFCFFTMLFIAIILKSDYIGYLSLPFLIHLIGYFYIHLFKKK